MARPYNRFAASPAPDRKGKAAKAKKRAASPAAKKAVKTAKSRTGKRRK